MIIVRSLAREIYGTLLAVTTLLVIVFLSNQLVHYLSYAAVGKISVSVLLRLLSLQLPYLLGLLLPIGLFLAILLTLGRWYANHEMVALMSSGFSQAQLLAAVVLITSAVVGLAVTLSLVINPIIAAKKAQLISADSPANSLLETLLPGRFMMTRDNRRVVYAEDVALSHHSASNVFIAEQVDSTNNARWTVVMASSGYDLEDEESGDQFIVAQDGYRYQGTPGENNFMIVKFKKYGIKIDYDPRQATIARLQSDAKPTAVLWHSTSVSDRAELQWRLSVPLVALILAILAVPLSRVKPRQGRFVQLIPALIICMAYVNLLFMARTWLERAMTPALFGLWWVHGLFLLLASLLLYYYGSPQRLRWSRSRS